ncbi:hypothetical protein IU501_35430 [Nocardia otitidiscaviarum]|uniref:hypothetical protein n=1 Tax=Nocardia otitidiscaviarum TaxID=1823 RepID=UPI0018943CC5|nr:hypothetical protein [Nocardia otitidiscaviarum]MBF6138267.1 hypothetical protein [Nocardia otitidiscaviarum]
MGRYANQHRAYELWTDERYVELVELLATELTLGEIAQRIGRSLGAVQTQVRKLVPLDYPMQHRDFEQVVRELLKPPSYDWRAVLRERFARANQVYWDSEMVAILREGWEQARALEEITEALGASELEVARQLMRMDLAQDSREVVTRLGCDPRGTLAGRLRLAQDRAASAVWVLVVDGAKGTSRIPVGVAEARRSRRHTSVHLDYDTADLLLDELLRAHVDGGGDITEVTASISERTVGELTVGFDADPARPGAFDRTTDDVPVPDEPVDLDREVAGMPSDPVATTASAPLVRVPPPVFPPLPSVPRRLLNTTDPAARPGAAPSDEQE